MPGPRRDTVAYHQRLAEVELVWASGQWTYQAALRLAAKYAVSERQLRADRLKLERHHRAEIAPSLEPDAEARAAAKVELIVRARLLFAQALRAGHTSTCARLLDFEARITGANAPVEIAVTLQPVETLSDEDLARQILDPDAISWARRVLDDVGEQASGVLRFGGSA